MNNNKVTFLLVVCALLLGLNIGMLLNRDGNHGVSVLSSAVAGTATISPRGDDIFTCSEDGTKLYMWSHKNAQQNNLNPWVAIEYTR